MDPTGNIKMIETKYKGRPLGIVTMYRPQKVEGPLRVHTQAVNMICCRILMEEPINVAEFLYDELEDMVEKIREGGGSIVIGGDSNEE